MTFCAFALTELYSAINPTLAKFNATDDEFGDFSRPNLDAEQILNHSLPKMVNFLVQRWGYDKGAHRHATQTQKNRRSGGGLYSH